jgi:HAD superfamily hydrolase (TIGR01490 family)
LLHVFDLDHTLLVVNSSFDFSLYLFRKRKLGCKALLSILYIYTIHKFISLEECHERAFAAIFKGKKRDLWSQEMKGYLEERFDRIVSPAVYERLEKVRERAAIFSSSPDFIVEAIAKYLNVNWVLSSKYEVDKENRFVKIASLINGEEKRIALLELAKKQRVALRDVTAYSDSILDLPLLKLAGTVVCVNPDRQLREVAKLQQWEVISHDNTCERSTTVRTETKKRSLI